MREVKGYDLPVLARTLEASDAASRFGATGFELEGLIAEHLTPMKTGVHKR